ncbi:serine/threonine protein kinase [Bacillus sp. DX1.1]|uniref:serine/threonine protein kinase n=1 Tax=unclassified Bacillus (in: firmicutes) TaxID=185979 RepID=UPI00257112C5|nr:MULTISPECIES: serine/threonine protein kinase [unclassified Bacillus (in: firmicutes)]MDM5155116.1 serine/threonine protein kinase [Bacillus sp. DX1.1]WJE79445.1 serine/threonine protein kinase [Bacillus sp. DX3.1]
MSEFLVTLTIDDVSFKLKEYQDFEWLIRLGKVFCVFNQQDSGNICFGIEKDGKKKFVKYAGAKTMEYSGQPQDAIVRLQEAIVLYEELKHENLIKLIDHFDVEHGYVAIFDWFDGECLHPHWTFPPPAKYNHPDSPFFRYKQLPIEYRLASLDRIFSFHVYIEKKNYVAVDFYDGSILYNFNTNRTKICDIDFYQKKTYINRMGRLWGSSRFMSPEEFELGAVIDERTNVFNMGAIAFGLLGGELDRSFSKWDAGKELYEIASHAVEKNRNQRYTSVAEFYLAWESARSNMMISK